MKSVREGKKRSESEWWQVKMQGWYGKKNEARRYFFVERKGATALRSKRFWQNYQKICEDSEWWQFPSTLKVRQFPWALNVHPVPSLKWTKEDKNWNDFFWNRTVLVYSKCTTQSNTGTWQKQLQKRLIMPLRFLFWGQLKIIPRWWEQTETLFCHFAI